MLIVRKLLHMRAGGSISSVSLLTFASNAMFSFCWRGQNIHRKLVMTACGPGSAYLSIEKAPQAASETTNSKCTENVLRHPKNSPHESAW